MSSESSECPHANSCVCVCVYYCRTYYKAVRGGGRRRVEDMCYERRRAEACVDESAHHAVFSIVCVQYMCVYYVCALTLT